MSFVARTALSVARTKEAGRWELGRGFEELAKENSQMCVCVCVCARVYVRERAIEKDRER